MKKKLSFAYYILSFIIPAFIILIALAGLKVTPFGDNTLLISDGNALYVNYLGYIGRVVKGQEDVLFSLEKGLGGNMLGSWGWFLLNPFFALFALFDITAYPLAFTWVSLLNFSACGLTMYILLKDIYGHKLGNLIFSTAYALNGFLVANVFQMNFFTGVILLPLMVMGLRRILHDRNPLLYIISLAFSLLSNFYFGFMLCVASVLIFAALFTANWNQMPRRKSVVIKYSVSSLLSGLLSCFVWLPALLSLRGGRLDQTVTQALTFRENMPFMDMFSKLFTGANDTAQLSNGLPNIFVGILPVALAVLFFMNGRIPRRRRVAAGALLGFYLISFYIVIFNLAMHGGTVTNWFNYRDSFVFSFLLLMIAAEEWRYVADEPDRNLKRAGVGLLVGTLVVFAKQYDFVIGGEVLLDFALLALMALALFMHRSNPAKNPRRTFELVALVLVCVNLYANYEISTKNILDWGKSVPEYQEIVAPVSALVDAVKASDGELYRMEINEQRSGNEGNDPMLYGYNGVGHGGSDDRDFVRNGLAMLGVHRFDMRNYYGKGITAATDDLLGLRYLISKDDTGEEKHYEKLVNIGQWALYRNADALPLAFAANGAVDGVELEYTDVFENLNRVWSAVSGEDTAVFIEENDISFTSHNITEPLTLSREEAAAIVGKRDAENMARNETGETDNSGESESESPEYVHEGTLREPPENIHYIMFTWTADRDGAVYTYNRSGVADDRGAVLPALNYEGYYHAGDTITGYLPVATAFVTESLLQDVAGRFRAAYVDTDALHSLSETVRQRPSTVEKLTDSHLRGAFTAEAGQKLLFTIPYDEGWALTVDGQKAQLTKTLGLFMTADVAPGAHSFELKFTPSGLKIGLIVSVLAFFGCIVLLLLDMKRRKNEPAVEENTDVEAGNNAHEEADAPEVPAPTPEKNAAIEKREPVFLHYSRRDWLAAILVSIFVLAISSCLITTGMPSDAWDDDFAGYLNEGFAIADGHFQEQTKINYFYHPSNLAEEVSDGRLVYVWGYPLVQAVVYKLIGFDFNNIIWYKVPLLLSLSLTGGVLVLFFRRRFSLFVSVFMSILFCMSGSLHDSLDKLGSDLPFLFLSMLTLLMMEVFTERVSKGKKTTWFGVACGAVMWMTYETRLSGSTVCIAALIGYAIAVLQKKIGRKDIWKICIPYAVMLVLIFISEHLWLAPATSNMSDLAQGPGKNNFEYYTMYIHAYYATLLGTPLPALGYALIIISVIGMVARGFRENLHLTLLLLGTIITVYLLPYLQGLRYLYNVLPFIIMYLVYGFQFLAKHVGRLYISATENHAEDNAFAIRRIGRLVTIATLTGTMIVCCISPIGRAAYNLRHWGEKGAMDVYSPEAIEMYRYIEQEIPEDKVIAFPKPRALYLNTGRLSFRPGVNGHALEDADYYLLTTFRFGDFLPLDLSDVNKTVVYENAGYTLYKLN